MAAKHKFQNARVTVRTSLPGAKLVELAKAAGEAVTNKIPGQAAVRVEAHHPMSVRFTTRGLGGMTQIMGFAFNAVEAGGATTGHSEITSFKTSQPKYMFIPIGPKSLLGWAQYKKFVANLTDAVKAADPSASVTFVERPA